jgi:hypothetical protein
MYSDFWTRSNISERKTNKKYKEKQSKNQVNLQET